MTDFELPLLRINSVSGETTAALTKRLAVINRDPSPDETGIPVDANVGLTLVALASSTLVPSSVRMYVGGVLASRYDEATGALGFTAEFQGASASVVQGGKSIRLVVDRITDFASSETVEVIVEAGNSLGEALRETYSFTATDKTPPLMLSAQALDQTTVRVVFNEAIKLASLPGFAFVATSAPAVVPGVSTVTVNGKAALVTLDTELTPGATYQVQAVGVTDALGNAISSASAYVNFLGFSPLTPPGRNFSIWELFPRHNRRSDGTGDLARFAACLQDVATLLLCSIDFWPNVFDLERAPEAFVDLMLLDLGNPFDFELSLADKRRLVSLLVKIYQQKGTEAGIINAIRFFLELEITIQTYATVTDEYRALLAGSTSSYARYAFIVIAPRVLSDDERGRIKKIVRYMKPCHTHFTALVEPKAAETTPNHWQLGSSRLALNTLLHAANGSSTSGTVTVSGAAVTVSGANVTNQGGHTVLLYNGAPVLQGGAPVLIS